MKMQKPCKTSFFQEKSHQIGTKKAPAFVQGLYFQCFKSRAEDGAQTRDPQLGRLMLYRLSYFRNLVGSDGFEPP